MSAFVIGIGGGSASGKTTIAAELRDRLAPLRVLVINQDKYFRPPDRLPRHRSPDGAREWPDHNHPDTVDFATLAADLRAVKQEGEAVKERGRAVQADIVILEGHLVLHDAALRELMDLKLFIETDTDERIVRRIRRNVARGYDLDGICDFYLDSVRYRHAEFCAPTKAHADRVIPGGRYERPEAEAVLDRVVAEVRERVTRPVSIPAPEVR